MICDNLFCLINIFLSIAKITDSGEIVPIIRQDQELPDDRYNTLFAPEKLQLLKSKMVPTPDSGLSTSEDSYFENQGDAPPTSILHIESILAQLGLCQGMKGDGQGVMLFIPEPLINATASQNVLLSVQYVCNGTPSIEWQHSSNWWSERIIAWKTGHYVNVSEAYVDRIKMYENGSIQLENLSVKDTGYYVITVTEDSGKTKHDRIFLTVQEILYEDFFFVAVFIAFLAAGSAVLICLMWLCNKCINVTQRRKQIRREEEIEMRIISD
ncbi:V-set and transmembrane domain-containing protein 5 [Pelodytes ibericus]